MFQGHDRQPAALYALLRHAQSDSSLQPQFWQLWWMRRQLAGKPKTLHAALLQTSGRRAQGVQFVAGILVASAALAAGQQLPLLLE
jgi:hypothetical protein